MAELTIIAYNNAALPNKPLRFDEVCCIGLLVCINEAEVERRLQLLQGIDGGSDYYCDLLILLGEGDVFFCDLLELVLNIRSQEHSRDEP